MNKLEFNRILGHVPGTKFFYIEETSNKVYVYFIFKWYMFLVKDNLLSFIADIFSYVKIPGIILVFSEGSYNHYERTKSKNSV